MYGVKRTVVAKVVPAKKVADEVFAYCKIYSTCLILANVRKCSFFANLGP